MHACGTEVAISRILTASLMLVVDVGCEICLKLCSLSIEVGFEHTRLTGLGTGQRVGVIQIVGMSLSQGPPN